MLVRTTALAAMAAATALAAGGTTATVVLSASDQGVTASTERTSHSQAGAEHGNADAAGSSDVTTATVTPPPCPADVKNHGAYVSSVAKTDKAEDAEPGAHGALVSAAAQSDCGAPEGGTEGSQGSQESQEGANDASEAGKDNASDKGQDGQELGAARGRSAEHANENASHAAR